MTIGWTLAGTFAELMLAGFLFMLVVFSAGGMANGIALGKLEVAILDLSMVLLPGLCLASAGYVVYLHAHGGSASSYRWYLLPVAATVLYFLYAAVLLKRSRADRSEQACGRDDV